MAGRQPARPSQDGQISEPPPRAVTGLAHQRWSLTGQERMNALSAPASIDLSAKCDYAVQAVGRSQASPCGPPEAERGDPPWHTCSNNSHGTILQQIPSTPQPPFGRKAVFFHIRPSPLPRPTRHHALGRATNFDERTMMNPWVSTNRPRSVGQSCLVPLHPGDAASGQLR